MSLINSTYPLFTSGNFRLYLENRDHDLDPILNSTCQLTEDDILCKLLGDVLYLDFKNKQTTNVDYIELINGYKVENVFAAYDHSGTKRVYYGLKDMLAYFTYFNYVTGKKNFNPTEEQKTASIDKINPVYTSYEAYNMACKLYYSAYYFIIYKQSLDSTKFPDFDYTHIELINSFGI